MAKREGQGDAQDREFLVQIKNRYDLSSFDVGYLLAKMDEIVESRNTPPGCNTVDVFPDPDAETAELSKKIIIDLGRVSRFLREHHMDGLTDCVSNASARIGSLTKSYLQACAEVDRLNTLREGE